MAIKPALKKKILDLEVMELLSPDFVVSLLSETYDQNLRRRASILQNGVGQYVQDKASPHMTVREFLDTYDKQEFQRTRYVGRKCIQTLREVLAAFELELPAHAPTKRGDGKLTPALSNILKELGRKEI